MLISFIRTVILYSILILVIRLMGKRQLGEMEPREFVVTMLLANLAAVPMQETGSPLLAPGEDGINGVNLANSSQLSAWTGREVSNPCDPEEYAAELNKLIEAEGKFPVRE